MASSLLSWSSRRGSLVALGSALILVAAGCSSSAQGEPAPSEADYRAAVERTADCVAKEGFDVSEVELRPDDVTYGFSITSSNDTDLSLVDGAFAQCSAAHLDSVESRYLGSLELSGAEREAVYAEFTECLKSAGVETVVVGDEEGIVTSKISAVEETGVNVDDAWRCQQKYLIPLFGS